MRAFATAVALSCAGFALLANAELVEVLLKPSEAVEKRFAVQPEKFAELCAALKRNQTVNWQFRTSTAMDFNIHYHVGERVEYPDKREGVSHANGSVTAKVDQSYCWMWINRATTSGTVEVRLIEAARK
jgi:hypothetical protein